MEKKPSYEKYDPSWGVEPIPDVPETSLVEMWKTAVERTPEKPAVIFLEKSYTYAELDRMSDRFAAALSAMGIGRGDRVATMLPNSAQHVIAFYGILKAGAVIVPFNVMLKGEEAGYILEDAGAKALVVLDVVYPLVKGEVERLGIDHVITVHVKDFAGPGADVPPLLAGEKAVPEGTVDFMEIVAGGAGKPPEATLESTEELAMILYTSGTTGFPKGAMVTHGNFHSAAVRICAIAGLRQDDVLFMLFPQFHIAGYILNLIPAVYRSATVVPVPLFDPGVALRLFERHRVTCFFSPPTGYIGMLNHPDFARYDLSSVRLTVACGAPVPPALQREWQEKVGTYLYNGYGATETTGVAPGIIEMEHRRRSEGGTLGVPTCEIKIVDAEGKTVPRGTVGEFLLRGPGVVKGYWNKPDKTREAFTEDGWWRSGDAGYMDDEGFIYFVERIKDLIIASGYNIAPVEVENHLFQHPAVQDAAVVGIPDPYRGETVKAFVVLKEDHRGRVTEEEIIRFCRERMAVYKAPRQVEFIEDLPKTASGKVLRRLLRER